MDFFIIIYIVKCTTKNCNKYKYYEDLYVLIL